MRIALCTIWQATLTDLPKRASELLGSDVKHAERGRAIELIMAESPPARCMELWSEYDAAATPEARLVRRRRQARHGITGCWV